MFIGKDADFPLVGLRLIHRDVGISEELIGRFIKLPKVWTLDDLIFNGA